jgi:hypothetical protein
VLLQSPTQNILFLIYYLRDSCTYFMYFCDLKLGCMRKNVYKPNHVCLLEENSKIGFASFMVGSTIMVHNMTVHF